MSEWISVTERIPPSDKEVLVYDEIRGMFVCFTTIIPDNPSYNVEMRGKMLFQPKSSGCGCCDADMEDVKYWMELPKRPNE